ncbi:MAG: hypothetical protein R6U04_04265 [Bacteroidales bacterium]
MNTEERIRKQRELVETIGRYYENEGLQPTAARILALLMVMDKERFTFEEIIEELQISKSSASIALRILQTRGDVDYITMPGDKKRYFEIKKKEPLSLIDDFEQKMKEIKELLERIIALKANSDSPNGKFFKDLIKMLNFFFERIEFFKQEFRKNQ